MTTLYIKTHNKTGLKYFGMTRVNKTFEEIHRYRGSGTYWKKHIKHHGYDVTTEIYDQFDENDKFQLMFLKATAIIFSETNNIVNSLEWANLTNETGENVKYTKEMIRKAKETKSKKGPDGKNGFQRGGEALSKYLNTIQENGKTVAENRGAKISFIKQQIEPNGLTRAQNAAIKGGKTNKELGLLAGGNNGRAMKIKIFNCDGILMFDCNGTFLKICEENNLSKRALKKSYENGGKPCVVNKNYKHMYGWYAIKEEK